MKRSDTKSEIPVIPSFNKFLNHTLKNYLTKELRKKGYFNGVVEELVKYYERTFYYSSLPNLREQSSYSH